MVTKGLLEKGMSEFSPGLWLGGSQSVGGILSQGTDCCRAGVLVTTKSSVWKHRVCEGSPWIRNGCFPVLWLSAHPRAHLYLQEKVPIHNDSCLLSCLWPCASLPGGFLWSYRSLWVARNCRRWGDPGVILNLWETWVGGQIPLPPYLWWDHPEVYFTWLPRVPRGIEPWLPIVLSIR